MECNHIKLKTFGVIRNTVRNFYPIFTLRAQLSGAVYCNRSCLSVYLFVCLLFVGLCVSLRVCVFMARLPR